MTESHDVSIDEVRALVAERQRFDDWLTALDARRAETPSRVFERVQGDYIARRREVIDRLREHVGGLATTGEALEGRLATLESQLGALEDERAEAMLRTAVGEYDSDRWEQVRQNVEAQIADLGEQRGVLLAEVDEVRTLLSSARAEPEPEVVAPEVIAAVAVDAAAATSRDASSDASSDESSDTTNSETSDIEITHFDGPHGVVDHELPPMHTTDFMVPSSELIADAERTAEHPVASASDLVVQELGAADATASGVTVDADPFGLVQRDSFVPQAAASVTPTADELADLDNALALFSADAPADPYGQSTNPLSAGLDGVDVFDDAELGDLRMSPPVTSTATVTPHTSHTTNANNASSAPEGAREHARDGFDDLAFLRSVVDPSAQSAAPRASSAGDQQKTLRCTECGTMNFPTEWYCERCGGELAAF